MNFAAPIPADDNAPAPLLDGVRVLLVDDTVDALEAFAELLAFEGASVTAVTRGRQALQAAEADGYDLLISDIAMPDMDGYELLAHLRRRPETARLPAIALTGYGWGKETQQAPDFHGFDAHLTKPVSFDTLLETIAAVRAAQ